MRFLLLTAAMLFFFTGCDLEYWWSRGQPPGSAALFSKSASQLNASLSSTGRMEIKDDIELLRSTLMTLDTQLASGVRGAQLQQNLSKLLELFSGLEGRLSMGSRAPYGELLGQLQGFEQMANETGTIDTNVFKLYGARSMFFLANELTVPAPILG